MSFTHQAARAADFLLSEANGQRSRQNIVIAAGSGIVHAGTVISQITSANAAVFTPDSGNTGDGVVSSISVLSSAVSGTYIVEVTEAASNGGVFALIGPDGNVIGSGQVGVPFSGAGIDFTIADGSVDFVVGDKWSIALNANLGEWVPYDSDGTNDGRRAAGGVLYAAVNATHADVHAVAIVRDAEVVSQLLVGLDSEAEAQLRTLGILVRS